MDKVPVLSPFKKNFLIQLAITLGIVVVFGFGLFLLGRTIAKDAANIEQLRTEKSNWSSSVQSYVSAKSQYEKKGREYEQILQNILPERDSLIDLKKDFQFLASGEGLDLNFSITGERTKESPIVGAVGVSLTIQGDSQDKIFSFLKRLGEFKYLFSIDSISFQKDEGKEAGSVPRVSATIKGEVLYRNS